MNAKKLSRMIFVSLIVALSSRLEAQSDCCMGALRDAADFCIPRGLQLQNFVCADTGPSTCYYNYTCKGICNHPSACTP
jgi:hypothetical protein